MKVGDIVRYWRSSRNHGLGVIIETEHFCGHNTSYKVQWCTSGEWGWYENDRLVSLCK
jgi:hypothetical protein